MEDRARNAGYEELDSNVETSPDAILIASTKGVIEFVNPAFEAMTGYSRSEVLGRTPAVVKSGQHSVDFYRDLWDSLLRGEVYRGIFVNRRKSGEIFHEEEVIIPFSDASGSISHFVAAGRDVSERLQKVDALKRRVTHDGLTGLPNRKLFVDRLGQALKHAVRHSEGLTVAIVDIDGFKSLNDTFGHAGGDTVLLSVASRLRQHLGEANTVSRLGGDEFGVILVDIGTPSGAAQILECIFTAQELPVRVGDRPIPVTLSIGACFFPANGNDETTLLQCASTAMYRVKRTGCNGYSFFGTPPAPSPGRYRHEWQGVPH